MNNVSAQIFNKGQSFIRIKMRDYHIHSWQSINNEYIEDDKVKLANLRSKSMLLHGSLLSAIPVNH